MNPSMRRWKPNETWVVENKNMKMAVVIMTLPILRCLRLYREMKRYEQNKTIFIPKDENKQANNVIVKVDPTVKKSL